MPIGGPGGQTYIPSPGGGPPKAGTPAPPSSTSSGTSAMSSQAIKVVGFVVAGVVLIALADVAPQAGIGLTAVLGLGVLLTHASELEKLTNGFSAAIGQPQTA